jgi:hypothetical protein
MQDTLIGISASYNIDQDAPRHAAEQYRKYLENKSSLATIPMYRSTIDGIDNLKFLYPIGGVPIVAHTILNAIDEKASVRVLGNQEVHSLVDLMNEELGTKVAYVPEGSKLSLGKSFDRIFTGCAAGRNYFVTGDIPFAQGYTKVPYQADVVIDFNSQSLLDGFSHIRRNFYNHGSINGAVHPFKEPNIFYFTARGLPVVMRMADFFYQNRKEGGLYRALVEYIRAETETNTHFRMKLGMIGLPLVLEVATVYLQKRSGLRRPINLKRAGWILSKAYQLDWRFTFTHKDIFRMLDIDGINNDWVLYEGLARTLKARGKLDPRIRTIQTALQANHDTFPVVSHFEDIVRSYTRAIDEHLAPSERIDFQRLEEFFKRHETAGSVELADLILSSPRLEPSGIRAFRDRPGR